MISFLVGASLGMFILFLFKSASKRRIHKSLAQRGFSVLRVRGGIGSHKRF